MPARKVSLLAELGRRYPTLDDPEAAVSAGAVLVNGAVMTNREARVPRDASIVVQSDHELRGVEKLNRGMDALGVDVAGRIALDVGASAGGFTKALLHRGATRVYALDVGHGQLAGSLRQDDRVVNLEGINVSHLSHHPLADRVDVVTIDVSYLSLTRAVAQLPLTAFTAGADLVGLVKPMFELARGQLPTAPHDLQAAATAAADGVARAGWRVVSTIQSPTLGARGAIEFFVHARLP